MLKVRAHKAWRERHTAWLLEDDGDNVVADVSLPQQLLLVGRGVREVGGDVEHDLGISELCVDTVHTRRVGWREGGGGGRGEGGGGRGEGGRGGREGGEGGRGGREGTFISLHQQCMQRIYTYM